MPSDFICRKCDYTISLGWYHYHDSKDGYFARTKFACKGCGVTHYVEHPGHDSPKKNRYLYLRERSLLSEKHPISVPTGMPEISDDFFTGFDSFKCPVCETEGQVLLENETRDALPTCPLCCEEMELLTRWVS